MRGAKIALLISLASLAAQAEQDALVNTLDSSSVQIKEFFQSLEAVREADHVEALPLRSIGHWKEGRFEVVEEPARLRDAKAELASARLLDLKSYLHGMSACHFNPGMSLRFRRGADTVEAWICFECGELVFKDGTGQSLSGRMRLGPARWELLDMALEIWPDNETLRLIDQTRPPNKALQQTLDPGVPFAAAKGPSASRAAELGR